MTDDGVTLIIRALFDIRLELRKIRIFKANAEPTDVEVVPGQVLWIPAETHHGTNTGDAELKLLVVEFRDRKDEAMNKAEDKAEDKAKAD